LCKKSYNIGVWEKRLFRRQLTKNSENSDHNIEPSFHPENYKS
jgi:hypothetical protein